MTHTTPRYSPRIDRSKIDAIPLPRSAKKFMKLKLLPAFFILAALPLSAAKLTDNLAATANGLVEGTFNADTQVHAFKGIPFAAPPVGEFRWCEPQPVKNWTGTRKADKFGPRAMQRPIFGDMVFRSDGVSEDCLYLNVWTPAKSNKEHLPVLVYFYGGGFQAGDGSEPRYDGESMARKGIVAVTVNYRLNVFGFLAHPELTAESPHHASGNYGLLDQNAALQWVRKNIAAFGGDPKKVTIAGESAGSISVSAQMASPLSKHLIAGAIGESGSLLGALPPAPLVEAEKMGVKFATNSGAASLAELRAMSAQQLLDATAKPGARFPMTIDGYFLTQDPVATFAAGEQAHVPLLVGWNSEEMNGWTVLSQSPAGIFTEAVRKLYGDHADEALKVYSPVTTPDVHQLATELAGDRFIAFSTWKWSDLQGRTGGKPVFRYYYSHPRPPMFTDKPEKDFSVHGAVHSAEIEYALGNLPGNKVFAWTKDDYHVSETMQAYLANFVKTGNPNGPGLPEWPAANRGSQIQFMRLDVESKAEPERHRDRYLFLDQLAGKK